MELDDLRRTWQHLPPAAEPVMDERALTGILSQKSDGPIERLRRNARLEVGLCFGYLIVSIALIIFAPALRWRALGVTLVPVCLVCFYFLYRKLRLLQGMAETERDLHGHLIRVTTGMRSLVRFYYGFTLATFPIGLLFGFLIRMFDPNVAHSPFSSKKLAISIGVLIVVGVIFWWGVAHFTRWYLQRLYGQHLDRLEGMLRELEE